jgi:serine/threonine protein kinase
MGYPCQILLFLAPLLVSAEENQPEINPPGCLSATGNVDCVVVANTEHELHDYKVSLISSNTGRLLVKCGSGTSIKHSCHGVEVEKTNAKQEVYVYCGKSKDDECAETELISSVGGSSIKYWCDPEAKEMCGISGSGTANDEEAKLYGEAERIPAPTDPTDVTIKLDFLMVQSKESDGDGLKVRSVVKGVFVDAEEANIQGRVKHKPTNALRSSKGDFSNVNIVNVTLVAKSEKVPGVLALVVNQPMFASRINAQVEVYSPTSGEEFDRVLQVTVDGELYDYSSKSTKSKQKSNLKIGILTAAALLLIGMCLVGIHRGKKHRRCCSRPPNVIFYGNGVRSSVFSHFAHDSLEIEFNQLKIWRHKLLGSGGEGRVFAGTFGGQNVAIKQYHSLPALSAKGVDAGSVKAWSSMMQHRTAFGGSAVQTASTVMAPFKREIKVLASLRHVNMTLLYGYSIDKAGTGAVYLVHELAATNLEALLPSIEQYEETNISPGSSGRVKHGRVSAFPMKAWRGSAMRQNARGNKRTITKALPLSKAAAVLRLRLCIAQQVAEGFAFLHSKHILHRDLKPSNILSMCSSLHPSQLRLKISDFGRAREAIGACVDGLQRSVDGASLDAGAKKPKQQLTVGVASYRTTAPELMGIKNGTSAGTVNGTSAGTVSVKPPRSSSMPEQETKQTKQERRKSRSGHVSRTKKSSLEYSYPVDVYSYGHVIWAVWEGKSEDPALKGKAVAQALNEICFQNHRPAVTAGRGYPEEVQCMLMGAWSAEPAKRPTFKHICKTLRALLRSLDGGGSSGAGLGIGTGAVVTNPLSAQFGDQGRIPAFCA